MLLDNNTEKVIHLAQMFDDINDIDKIRLALHLLEDLGFTTIYDIQEIKKFLQEILGIIEPNSKKVLEIIEPNSKNKIINFSKYKNLLFMSAKYMELSLLEKQRFSVEMLFNIFQHDFKNEEINTIINQELNVYEYYYSLN